MPCWPPLPAPKKATRVPSVAGTTGSGGMNEVKLPAPFGIGVCVSATATG